uniref:Uncharacterized protein n=1 Tax=Lepeophtheirus salmonis TaxID=72036 RepID=A0A0K2TCG3_LEPSM
MNLSVLLLVLTILGVPLSITFGNESEKKVLQEDVGSGRSIFPWYFPFLPQWKGVNIGGEFNTIKSPEDVGFFMTRAFSSLLISNIGWLIVHILFWRGTVTRSDELQFPFNIITLFFGSNDSGDSDELLLPNSEGEINGNDLINFYTDPKVATQNLIISGGFTLFTLLLWIIPTFFWSGRPLPTKNTDSRVSRLYNIIDHVRSGGNSVDIYNRLLCPQCVSVIISINVLLFLGKWIFWSVLSELPDSPAFGVPNDASRSLKDDDESLGMALLHDAIDNFLNTLDVNVNNIIKDIETRDKQYV